MPKLTMCCLFGGMSPEHEISLLSAGAIIANTPTEYEVLPIGITRTGEWFLYTGATENISADTWHKDTANCHHAFFAPKKLCVQQGEQMEFRHVDVVFPAMHGAYGEDGRIAGMLEAYGIPFVGSGCAAGVVCMDKARTKLIVAQAGIPQADYIQLEEGEPWTAGELDRRIAASFGYPVFVKPASTGSSVGVSKAKSRDDLAAAVENATIHGGRVLIERAIVGREIEVSVLGNASPVASVCGEIKPGAEFYCYDNKYNDDTATYYIPADISPKCADKVREYALIIFAKLGCRGLARVDFFVTPDEEIYFNEINTMPGFTPISMYPKMLMHQGMSYGDVVTKLLELGRDERG